MDEIDLQAEREGQAIRTIKQYTIPQPRRPQGINRQNVPNASKGDFVELLKAQRDV